jgi:tetratricopeptide (TPR) repeat protein
MKTNKLKGIIKNALRKMIIFNKLHFDFESRKDIEYELSEGHFSCEELYGDDDSSYEKRYYRIAVKYYLSLADLENDKYSLLKLGASYFVLKRYRKAIETLTKAVTLFPLDIQDGYLCSCFRLRAWAYCLNGNYKESIMDYTRCKEWDNSYHWHCRYWLYFRGMTHFDYKHYYEAICDFSELLKRQSLSEFLKYPRFLELRKDPHFLELCKHHNFSKMRNHRSFCELYKQCTRIMIPTDPWWGTPPLCYRAISYIKIKEYTKAIADYTTLIEDTRFEYFNLNRYMLYLERGKLFRKIGKYDKAKNDFRLAKIIDKQNKKEIRLAKKRRECCG